MTTQDTTAPAKDWNVLGPKLYQALQEVMNVSKEELEREDLDIYEKELFEYIFYSVAEFYNAAEVTPRS